MARNGDGAGCWILDAGYWMLDTGYWMRMLEGDQ